MKPSVLRLSLLVFVPLLLSLFYVALMPKKETSMKTYEVFGVKIEKNPSQSKLTDLGVSTWPMWEGGPTKIPWSFKEEETMYLLEGKVRVTVEGSVESFEIGGGDLVVFPKGMNITWEVIEAVKKHYSLKK
ncbi:hypothetical protein JHK82_045493 [Glycine max]|uniref:(S)-ureidoglycine aminohydrolase cupin domain-containing protein n=1 Tax=Glycine max TaxID=3847 RepID=I1MQ98_SOYBN|nr:uncharacterized protein LOC100791372 [Glycine max]KAG4941817.1 hypothetical protein JHK87_045688 [Glycine soja]KAG4939777.1 hypothetical protein JHK86_045918 [Glycine max]KAG5100441.1 hypothetical protein JHK82_045493 [Glycine max]KAH1152174.1 hypothetical protein GYH30_045600 [Glycine max]KRH09245.1 hypothetical protein GLYMA_16G205600v4 [Glycine max]|eukprot:XP_003548252.1 uncharacterized protein LOC100791372 [Glycine max]